jgi:hypothetical protein
MDITYLNQVVVSATTGTTILHDSKEIVPPFRYGLSGDTGLINLPIAYLPSLTSPTAPYSPSDTFPPFFAFYSLTSFSSVFSEYCVEIYGLTTDEEIEYVYGKYYRIIKNNILSTCLITDVSASTVTCFPSITGYNYSLDVIVTYSNVPGSGTLDVNGKSSVITTSPQTVRVSGHTRSDGPLATVIASFSVSPYCNYSIYPTIPC